MPADNLHFEERIIRRLPESTPLSHVLPHRLLETAAPRQTLDRIADDVRAGLVLPESDRRILRSIVAPGLRPAIEIFENSPVEVDHPLWGELNTPAVRDVLTRISHATGRIECSSGAVFIGVGTGFLVGNDLVVTNRHVADYFAIAFSGHGFFVRPGFEVRINFCREVQRWDTDPTSTRPVVKVEMMHPWFDLALLRIEDRPDGAEPLALSTDPAAGALDLRCGIVGYPSFNPDEDQEIQSETVAMFDRKHVSPGVIDAIEEKFFKGRALRALGHDSSTLTGNSGSALVRLDDGAIIGLHFTGNMDGLNWAVPSSDIALDTRIVDAGVSFDGTPTPADGPWTIAWASV